MRGTLARFGLALIAAMGAVALVPATAGAVVSGQCTATQQGSSSPVNLNADEVWHLKKADTVTGQGASQPELNGVTIYAVNLGIPLPVYSTSDKGHGGSTDRSYHVADYSRFSRVIYVSGSAGGGACSGHIKVIVDDESSITNGGSLGALALLLLGVIILLAAILSQNPGVGPRILGAVGGLLAGVGVGVLLEELGSLDPSSLFGLAFPLLGILIGAVVPGLIRRGGTATA